MKKILIIEDDPLIGRIYRTHLEKAGYQVEIATDGEIGLARADTERPDAVLVDMMLPKKSGLEVLKAIRAKPESARTPVIVFTNAYVPQMIENATQAGATRVLNKSTITPTQLLDYLREALAEKPGA